MSRRVLGVLLVAVVGAPLAAQVDVAALAAQLADRARAAAAVDALVEAGRPAAEPVAEVLVHGDARARRTAAMVLRRLGPGRASAALPTLIDGLDACTPTEAPALYAAVADVAAGKELVPSPLRDRLFQRTQALLQRCAAPAAVAVRQGFVRASIAMRHSGITVDDSWARIEGNFVVDRELAAVEWARRARSQQELAMACARLADVPLPCDGVGRAFGSTVPVEDRFALQLAHAIEVQQHAALAAAPAQHYHLLYGDEQERVRAAAALARPGAAAANAVTALLEGLDDPSERVVAECVTSLGVLGPAARAAHPRLIVLAVGDSPLIAACAQAALRQIAADHLTAPASGSPRPTPRSPPR